MRNPHHIAYRTLHMLVYPTPVLPFLSEWGDVQDIRNQGIFFLPPQNLLYPLRILMALLVRSAVMPSYGLVRMKCGSCESCITYSSSIITYRPSSWRLSAIHDAISTMILLRYQHWSLLLFSLVQPLSPGRRKLHTCLPRISHDT